MKSIIDSSKIKRRALLSHTASVGGLFASLAGVLLPLFLPKYAGIASILIVSGLGTAMVGIYFANRWVRKPRPEDNLDQALKSFHNSYRLYHYPALPCDHILLTPGGLVLLETVSLAGLFKYHGGRWTEKMTFGRAMRFIVEEHLGDPIKSVQLEQAVIQERLKSGLAIEGNPVEQIIPIKPVVVFTHPDATLEVEALPLPVCRADKLKKYVPVEGKKLAPELYDQLRAFLDRAVGSD